VLFPSGLALANLWMARSPQLQKEQRV